LPALVVDGGLAALGFLLELANLAVVAWFPQVYADMIPAGSLPVTAGGVAATALVCLPAVWRRRAPVAVLALLTVLTGAATAALSLPLGWWCALGTLYEVALERERPLSLAALVLVTVASFASLLSGFPQAGAATIWGSGVSYPILFGSAWLLGWRARSRRTRERLLEAREQERSLRTVAEERGRIARQLHDILAHSIGLMVELAAEGRAALPAAPGRAGQALERIESTGRQSMGEVRRLLGLLRGEAVELPLAPQPGLDQLADLLAEARGRGLRVDVSVEGEPAALEPGVDLSAYRILEEALANVVKHAGHADVTVRLTYLEDLLRVDVRDHAGGSWGTARVDEGGGLLGMRERALLVGGTLEAGPTGAGFAVTAHLPLAASGSLVAAAEGPGA
jgi:signal transduction histidine kinase